MSTINFSVLYIPLQFTNSLYAIDKNVVAPHTQTHQCHSTQIFNKQKIRKKKIYDILAKSPHHHYQFSPTFYQSFCNVDRFGTRYLSVGVVFRINILASQISFCLREEKRTKPKGKKTCLSCLRLRLCAMAFILCFFFAPTCSMSKF